MTSTARQSGPLEAVPTKAAVTKAPVGVRDSAAVEPGLTARLVAWRDVTVRDRGPGADANADATAFTVAFDNRTQRKVSLASVQVNLTFGNDTSASPVNVGVDSAGDDLAPGSSARRTFSFAIPERSKKKINLAVTVAPGAPTVVFTGSIER